MSKTKLQRVKGSRFQALGSNALYIAEDHLLFCENMGYTESYKRFYFKEIQALIQTRSSEYVAKSIGFTLWLIINGYFLITANEMALRIGLGIAAGIGLFLLIHNLVLGGSCKTHIITGAGITHLKLLSRKRYAAKLRAQLDPLIAEAQKDIPIDLTPGANEGESLRPATPEATSPFSTGQYFGRGLLLAGLFIFLDIIGTSLIAFGTRPLSYFKVLSALALIISIVVSFRQVPVANPAHPARKAVWGMFILALLQCAWFYALFIVGTIEGNIDSVAGLFDHTFSADAFTAAKILYSILIALSFIIGLSAIVAHFTYKKNKPSDFPTPPSENQPPPLPPKLNTPNSPVDSL